MDSLIGFNLEPLMRYRLFTAPRCALVGHAYAAEPEFSDVFTSGREGYKSIRIPSVVVTTKGARFPISWLEAKE